MCYHVLACLVTIFEPFSKLAKFLWFVYERYPGKIEIRRKDYGPQQENDSLTSLSFAVSCSFQNGKWLNL